MEERQKYKVKCALISQLMVWYMHGTALCLCSYVVAVVSTSFDDGTWYFFVVCAKRIQANCADVRSWSKTLQTTD